MTTRHTLRLASPGRDPRMEKSSTISRPFFSTLRRGFAVVAAVVGLCLGTAAQADSIKLGTLWIDNVVIDQFDGNELHYIVNSVPNKQYLTKIDGFKLAAYPQLEEAEKAITANKPKETLAAFKTVRGKAKEPWLRLWLDAKLVPLMDKEGEHLGAINTYLTLIETKAPASFLEDPPVKSTKALSKEDKAKVHDRLKKARGNAKDKTPLADALDELISASDPGAEPVTPNPANPNAAPGAADESLIPLPEFMIKDKPDAITKLLMRARFDAALERVNEELKSAAGGGKTSILLFQRGIAQFYVAETLEKDPAKKAEARQMFEDAGLSFFRIPTYFKNSPYVGPALMETAAVHLKIARPDVAKGLLELAEAQIDPDDKHLKGRLDKLNEQLAAALNK